MAQQDELYGVLRRVFAEQRYGVLATHGEEFPHTTIVCYAPADNLSSLLFVTPRPSRKYRYLTQRPQASLFVDNRTAETGSLHEAYGIEVRGSAVEVTDAEFSAYRSVYLDRYPELESFIDAETNAFLRLVVLRYDIVHDFQTVLQLSPPAGAPPIPEEPRQ